MIAHSQRFYFHSILLQQTALPHMSPPKSFAAEPAAFRCLVQSLPSRAWLLFDRTLDGADATNRQRPTVDDATGRWDCCRSWEFGARDARCEAQMVEDRHPFFLRGAAGGSGVNSHGCHGTKLPKCGWSVPMKTFRIHPRFLNFSNWWKGCESTDLRETELKEFSSLKTQAEDGLSFFQL